jgi:hypothetical protein
MAVVTKKIRPYLFLMQVSGNSMIAYRIELERCLVTEPEG